MPFCTKCGNNLSDDAKFCPVCGSAVNQQTSQNANTSENQQPQQPQQFQQPQQNFNQQANPKQNYTKNPDGTYTFTGPVNEDGMYVSDVEKNKYLNIFSYLGILFLIPLLTAKGSKYTRFHVNQGIILLICDVVYNIIKGIFMGILFAIMFGGDFHYIFSPMYGVYVMIDTVLTLVNLVFTAFAIYGIYNTCTGKIKELPIIGKFRILK